jgi:uncharacterized protein YecE (DUF72 family)
VTTPRAQTHIGTSGWSYAHWKGPFYPGHLAGDQMLEFYAQRFRSVEINSSFYRLPEQSTLQHWHDSTPNDFRFSVKASRYITHMKKLGEPHKTVPVLLDRLGTLGDKLGPILFQLPPHWGFNGPRLEKFLATLSREFRYAFEFRDPSWLNEQTIDLLSRHAEAFCIYELDGYLSPQQVTTDLVYLRLHGPDGAYQGSYDDQTLAGWAGAITTWSRNGLATYCYFDNDQHGYAAQNALRLQALFTHADKQPEPGARQTNGAIPPPGLKR